MQETSVSTWALRYDGNTAARYTRARGAKHREFWMIKKQDLPEKTPQQIICKEDAEHKAPLLLARSSRLLSGFPITEVPTLFPHHITVYLQSVQQMRGSLFIKKHPDLMDPHLQQIVSENSSSLPIAPPPANTPLDFFSLVLSRLRRAKPHKAY